MKWFHFECGANPYGIYDNRQDKFFQMIVAWKPTIVNNWTFRCSTPTPAYYGAVDYGFKKSALRDFAMEYQIWLADTDMAWGDVAWWQSFFTKYGRKYGLLREFRENGIC